MMNKTGKTMVDLCAGIGSFSLASERAGITVAGQVEIDEKRLDLLARHFPEADKLKDMRDVTADDFSGRRINIIAGGTPCQDLSVAGKRKGLAGEKSGIWYEYHRLVSELKPEWVVWENVAGSLSSNGGRDFLIILRGLDELGYRLAWRVFDSQYWRVPQRRRRVFLIGHIRDGRAAEVLFESEGMPGNSRTRPPEWKSPAGNSGAGINRADSDDNAGGELGSLLMRKVRSDKFTPDSVASTLAKRDYKDWGDLIIELDNLPPGLVSSVDVRNFNLNGDISGTLQAKKSGGWSLNFINPVIIKTDNTSSNGWGVLTDGTTHTLGGTQDAVMTLIEGGQLIIRRLTPRECEALQGFPLDYTAGYSDAVRYSMLGDSITVPVSEWIMNRIVAVDEKYSC